MSDEACMRCGYPRGEHHYMGACYGICGEFIERRADAMSDDWITQNYQIDRYGLALMMIREGCADPAGLARRVLAEFDGSSAVIPDSLEPPTEG